MQLGYSPVSAQRLRWDKNNSFKYLLDYVTQDGVQYFLLVMISTTYNHL